MVKVFLHLGENVVVPKKDVIMILDTRTLGSQATREFIEIAGDEGFIKSISNKNKEKSYIITNKEIFISPISCRTLQKRSRSFFKI